MSTSRRFAGTLISVDCGPARWSPGLGSQLTLVAVSFQAYGLTHSTLIVGLIGLAQLVPLLAGALWGGTLADAMDRRKVLVLTQVAMAMAVGGLVVNASLTHPAVWPLFACTAASAGFQGVDWPARRAALPMLVDSHDLTAAFALQTSIQQLALVAGPALAGILIATIGLSAVYGIDVATFGSGIRGRRAPPGPDAERRGHTDGVAVDDRRIQPSPPRATAFGDLLDRPQRHDLWHAPGGFSRAGTASLRRWRRSRRLPVRRPGAGALIGSLFTGWCSHVRHQGRAIAACVMVWGLTITLFGIIPVLWIGLVLLGLAGAADVISAVFRQAVQQRTVPDHLQGRLSGRSSPWWPEAPGWVMPKPGWRPPSAAPSSPCGQAGWPA